MKIRFSAATEYCTERQWNLTHQGRTAAVKRSKEETAFPGRGNSVLIVSTICAVLAHVRLFVIHDCCTQIEARKKEEELSSAPEQEDNLTI